MTARLYSSETASAATIVTASDLKNPPVTPEMNASGTNTTIVASVLPSNGTDISAADASTPRVVRCPQVAA